MPDTRTAQRLLDVLATLEQALRSGRHTTSAAQTGLEGRMANLEFENQRLKSTRQQAATRLNALLARLSEQLENPTEDSAA